eukprot:GHRR01016380.1.p1 GENE.GHRR01016380.1~~GHRR01016380.1.p1  ORF type:complete len:199 (+),score=63.61 GHRR01016380.1:664-1260(+)
MAHCQSLHKQCVVALAAQMLLEQCGCSSTACSSNSNGTVSASSFSDSVSSWRNKHSSSNSIWVWATRTCPKDLPHCKKRDMSSAASSADAEHSQRCQQPLFTGSVATTGLAAAYKQAHAGLASVQSSSVCSALLAAELPDVSVVAFGDTTKQLQPAPSSMMCFVQYIYPAATLASCPIYSCICHLTSICQLCTCTMCS